jgi:hypothetical protein
MPDREILRKLDKEALIDLLEDSAKNWLAHDGLWFQAVENEYDISAAIKMDKIAWRYFTQVEAKRIMRRSGTEQGGGIDALERALQFRLYARLNEQALHRLDETTLRYEMTNCRVQSARKRKNLDPFPCKPVGIIEYAYFAYTIDPRIRTSIIACPPDEHDRDFYCAWLFKLEDEPIVEDQLLPPGFSLE